MTDTTRNRSRILAQFLRAAIKDVRSILPNVADAIDCQCRGCRAVQSIEAVAEELEAAAVLAPPEPSIEPPV